MRQHQKILIYWYIYIRDNQNYSGKTICTSICPSSVTNVQSKWNLITISIFLYIKYKHSARESVIFHHKKGEYEAVIKTYTTAIDLSSKYELKNVDGMILLYQCFTSCCSETGKCQLPLGWYRRQTELGSNESTSVDCLTHCYEDIARIGGCGWRYCVHPSHPYPPRTRDNFFCWCLHSYFAKKKRDKCNNDVAGTW
jgi:hypothetical protein